MEAAFDLVAVLLGLAALFGYLNHRFLRLPHTVGLVVIALAVSFGVLLIDAAVPGWGLSAGVRGALQRVDFTETLMTGLLSFLLFAGALHVDITDLAQRKWAIAGMATVGVLISTALVGGGIWFVFRALEIAVPFAWCLVFGALISPTDPVAVLSILKRVRVPPSLQAKIAGESLFNDGVGVVLFTILVAIAGGAAGTEVGPLPAVALFLGEALGGVLLGLATGWLAFLAMRSLNEHNIEVIISLALVTVTYALAGKLHVSGPIAVVVAGLLIGNHGMRLAMSENTRAHIHAFWSLIDEVLNSLLFMLIGFEVVAISGKPSVVLAALCAVPLVLASRLVSVSIPIMLLMLLGRRSFTPGAIPTLTWGGLRGGISVALALSLPPSPEREVILTACYGVVIFSIVVQGLTMERLVRRAVPREAD
ncbi:MAG: cation:proton antiporter [Alphaproteobacteria bacterium]